MKITIGEGVLMKIISESIEKGIRSYKDGGNQFGLIKEEWTEEDEIKDRNLSILGRFIQKNFPEDLAIKIYCKYGTENRHHSIWIDRSDYEPDDGVENTDENFLLHCAYRDWRVDKKCGYGYTIQMFLQDLDWHDELYERFINFSPKQILVEFKKWYIKYMKTDRWEPN